MSWTLVEMRRAARSPGQFRAGIALAVALLLGLSGCAAEPEPPATVDDSASADPEADSGDGSGQRVELGASDALVWGGGGGDYGVVLVHGAAFDAASWEQQAARFADEGLAVLAVEDTSAETLIAAIDFLEVERGAQEVALLGASAGAAAVINAAVANPDSYDQLVLLSPAGGDVAALSDGPKFFIYSLDEGSAGSIEQLIADAPGQDNEVLAVEGSAHAQAVFETSAGADVVDAILNRLIG
ncbi:MAG: alpha/beta hydrolase [Actinomycetota bacterium]|nr:alpha/beta hydrolase [Actinomycetota bacterium]